MLTGDKLPGTGIFGACVPLLDTSFSLPLAIRGQLCVCVCVCVCAIIRKWSLTGKERAKSDVVFLQG